jgi:hypothetical protein
MIIGFWCAGEFRGAIQYLFQAIAYLKGSSCRRVLIHPGVYQLCSPRLEFLRLPSS